MNMEIRGLDLQLVSEVPEATIDTEGFMRPHDGMLLLPQHIDWLQYLAELRLIQRCQLYIPFYWGVKSCVINESALQRFTFEIEQCEIVTPEGSHLRYRVNNRSNMLIASEPFETYFEPTGQPLSVYLTVPKLRLDACNVSSGCGMTYPSQNENRRRYIESDIPYRDLYAEDGRTTRIPALMYNTRLVFSSQGAPSGSDEVIKIAELVKVSDGKGAQLSSRYIPPCLSVGASRFLHELLEKEILDAMLTKSRELTRGGYTGGGGVISLLSADLREVNMAQSLNRYAPLLHAVVEGRTAHPEDVYKLLLQIIGELSTYSQTISPLGERGTEKLVPRYSHNSASECFRAVTTCIRQLLDEMTGKPAGEIQLEHEEGQQGHKFFVKYNIVPHFFDDSPEFYLTIGGKNIAKHSLNALRAGAKERVESHLRNFVGGVFLKPVNLSDLPEGIRKLSHVAYFHVTKDPERWSRVERERNLVLDAKDLPKDADVRLLALRHRKEV